MMSSSPFFTSRVFTIIGTVTDVVIATDSLLTDPTVTTENTLSTRPMLKPCYVCSAALFFFCNCGLRPLRNSPRAQLPQLRPQISATAVVQEELLLVGLPCFTSITVASFAFAPSLARLRLASTTSLWQSGDWEKHWIQLQSPSGISESDRGGSWHCR